jgi:hypothetical protein
MSHPDLPEQPEAPTAGRCADLLECTDFREHPGWRNHPDKTGGVTWDAWCSMCGFRLEDKPWASGLAIEGHGRRLARVVSMVIIGGKRFVLDRRKIVCSKCCPVILGRHDEH